MISGLWTVPQALDLLADEQDTETEREAVLSKYRQLREQVQQCVPPLPWLSDHSPSVVLLADSR